MISISPPPSLRLTFLSKASEMLDWGVSPFNTQEFMKDMCTRYNVDPKGVPMLKVKSTNPVVHRVSLSIY